MNSETTTTELLKTYSCLRGKTNLKDQFWDIVCITAADNDQKVAYESQIQQKQSRGDIPLGIPYMVVSDPPGPKAGSGGATMHVISELYKLYAEALWLKRVLLINAGGQSQRLPSASILGKIFTALPLQTPSGDLVDLLDYKLACFLPFLPLMNPGIMHAAADTIEVYDLTTAADWHFQNPGFTALAHPSSLEIGQTHGVFVLPHGEGSLKRCINVLQKPTEQQMIDSGAVIDGRFVYTDSHFFFSHDVSKLLLSFYNLEGITCEIDAYGDFLQALGSSNNYIHDVRNVGKVEPSLIETREKVYQLLKYHQCQLHVLQLDKSHFYHLGTMPEILEHFCGKSQLKKQMGLLNSVFSVVENNGDYPPCEGDRASAEGGDAGIYGEAVILHSIVNRGVVADGSIIEYSYIHGHVSEGCIVSHTIVPYKAVIPENTFMYTAATQLGYVTVALHTYENVKYSVTYEQRRNLTWMKKPLTYEVFQLQQARCSLWNAKIFPVMNTVKESFEATLELVRNLAMEEKPMPSWKYLSLEDIMILKDVEKILEFRHTLWLEISKHKKSSM